MGCVNEVPSGQKYQPSKTFQNSLNALNERKFIISQSCKSGNKIDRFCHNQTCINTAMCCSNIQCQSCHPYHINCPFIAVGQLSQKVEKRLKMENQFFKELFVFQQKFIDKLIENRKQLIKKSNFWKFQSFSGFEQIFSNNSRIKGLNGKGFKSLFSQLTEKNSQYEIDKYIQSYHTELEKVIRDLDKFRLNLVQNSGKVIESKILLKDKEEGVQKYSYLLKQLGNPHSLKLLFRASQHNFSVKKFHDLCDGIKNTVTIIRTEFGKTIAAYTPLKWSSDSNGAYVCDSSKQSFLLQLELKQKMSLIQPQKAIYNFKLWGPMFGRSNHDLRIDDKCNQNQNSCSNFPTSYNCGGKYQCNQKSWTIFCGNPNGNNFRVLEYQVFEVRRQINE